MVDARALQLKLETEHAKAMAEIRSLERERAKVTLAAHSGDVKAKKRLFDIRARIASRTDDVRDIGASMDDVERQVARENRDRVREQSREAARQFDAVSAAIIKCSARIDAAVSELVAAMAATQPLIDAARQISVDLSPRSRGATIGEMAINRMLALDTSSLRPLSELMLIRLAELGAVPASASPVFFSQTISFASDGRTVFSNETATFSSILRAGLANLADEIRQRLALDQVEARGEADQVDAGLAEVV